MDEETTSNLRTDPSRDSLRVISIESFESSSMFHGPVIIVALGGTRALGNAQLDSGTRCQERRRRATEGKRDMDRGRNNAAGNLNRPPC